MADTLVRLLHCGFGESSLHYGSAETFNPLFSEVFALQSNIVLLQMR
jgi:hypothetical protein